MSKLITTYLSCILHVAAAANELVPVSQTRYDRAITAKTDLGDRVIATREMLVDIKYTDGRPRKGALVIFFDSASGRYLWEFGLVPQAEKTSTHMRGYGSTGFLYVANDRLVHFSFTGNLIVRESLGRASGIDDAEAKTLAEATGRLPTKLAGKTDGQAVVRLGKLLPVRFFAPDGSPVIGPMKVIEITHRGNRWELILQGQWQEKITLNDKYEVMAMARLN